MRASPREQRLEALEVEFKQLLISCLRECADGRWGLFGQNSNPQSISALNWAEAERLKEMAEEIEAIRSEFGQPNPLCERFLLLCSERGENLSGEPKRAKKFLKLLGIDW